MEALQEIEEDYSQECYEDAGLSRCYFGETQFYSECNEMDSVENFDNAIEENNEVGIVGLPDLPPHEVLSRIREIFRVFIVQLLEVETEVTRKENDATKTWRMPSFKPIRQHEDNVIFINGKKTIGQLTDTVPFGSRRYRQIISMLTLIHTLLSNSKTASLREVFYILISKFSNQEQSNKVISNIESILGCSRSSLGIFASPRGIIAGRLLIKEGSEFYNIANAPAGKSISHYMADLPSSEIISDASFILVIEKEGPFLSMVESRIFDDIPCIIITAKGYPDLSTRKLLCNLHHYLNIPIYTIVDADPHGLNIFLSYSIGSLNLESSRYVIDMTLIGITQEDIHDFNIPESALIDFSDSDKTLCEKLLRMEHIQNHIFIRSQLEQLLKRKKKAEIECLYAIDPNFLSTKYLPLKLQVHGHITPCYDDEWLE